MAYQLKPNTGSLFAAEKKEKETSPDFTGNVNFNGKVLRVAGWKNRTEDGRVWLKLALSEPQRRGQ